MPPIALDFIIPTKGRRNDLLRGLAALETIIRSECPSTLIVGVCISDSEQVAMDPAVFMDICPSVPVVYAHNPHAKSFRENLRAAIILSQGDYGWLMGDDDYITEGSISRIAEMLQSGPSAIHFNAIIKNSLLDRSSRLIPHDPTAPEVIEDIPLHCSGEEITYISCLVIKTGFLQDERIWSEVHPCEVAPHLRCLASAVGHGKSIAVREPAVVIEKTEDLVGEWNGSWCILLGYEIPLARHQFLLSRRGKPIQSRKLSTVTQEIRMHLILSIFRKSFPCLAEEASDFIHQYPAIRHIKKAILFLTSATFSREILKLIGQALDPRCKKLEA